MATRSTTLLEEAGFSPAWSQALHSCPEIISSIYTAHYQHVLQVCRRFFRQPEDAEDAAAEVFLKLHTVLDKKDEDHPFRPWVCQVAGRHCIDKLRRRKREKYSAVPGNDLCAVPDVSRPSPLSQVLHREAQQQVREELNRLPEYYKVPLVLRYYKHMSYSQIAERLNRRIPTVKTIIFRAKCRLRRNLLEGQKPRPVAELTPEPAETVSRRMWC
ncbi:MAG TPA: sigma-70 family RNA polymerase sigma factor [Candidatus Sulfotelmatobacter sp.]|nr:sigma-70 family RNA polymerase sigma factor [Candidatus Sulfotelmatobacter sp.]